MNWLSVARKECLMKMTAIEKMKKWREESGITLKQMSTRSGISESLLDLIENGGVTHPDIAKRFVKAYGFPEECVEELIPRNYRKGTDEYDPDRYRRMENVDGKESFRIVHKRLSEADIYVSEQQREIQKKHARKGVY